MDQHHNSSINIRISEDLVEAIDRIALSRRERRSVIVRGILLDYLLQHDLVPDIEIKHSLIRESRQNQYQLTPKEQRKDSNNDD